MTRKPQSPVRILIYRTCFQIDAFSMKTLSVLVWTEGVNAYKYVRFQTKLKIWKKYVRFG